ncbi:MAG TPA: sugar phosphate nucleotidyltransferase [Methanocella sp.]|uniref:sugar phosphate nucleotidyltransferase n=1 Tax=Methanocella sp. TaxID=2052833 RepID=UPI002C637DD7|nr:sugar phosphate nucleotidyltransferase [Methanocella sp.]HTY91595.1 sugar phosphate nucleotidyltransferase [Methanocella sp.]
MTMKVVIPAAGAGKRLYPHTYTKPKPMVFVAGKPIIGHILDRMAGLDPDEVIIVVGYMKDKIISYVKTNYSGAFPKITFVDQDQQLGLGHSIYVTRAAVGDSPILIVLGDMIFKDGYSEFLKHHLENGKCSGSIGVKAIDNPEHYGIVYMNDDCTVNRLVEKPKHSKSNIGIAGVYFIEDTPRLFSALEGLVSANHSGEIQLTDALQKAVEQGSVYKTFEVNSWYDCGRPASLLEVNRILLSEQCLSENGATNSIIIEPVSIGKNARITNSIIGPYVSISEGASVSNSIIEDSIVGNNAEVKYMTLHSSIIGDHAILIGKANALNIGDSSTIEF